MSDTYDIKKTKHLIRELDKLMATKPQFTHTTADLIIRNLLQGIKNCVRTIEYMDEQAELADRIRQSGGGSSNVQH